MSALQKSNSKQTSATNAPPAPRSHCSLSARCWKARSRSPTWDVPEDQTLGWLQPTPQPLPLPRWRAAATCATQRSPAHWWSQPPESPPSHTAHPPPSGSTTHSPARTQRTSQPGTTWFCQTRPASPDKWFHQSRARLRANWRRCPASTISKPTSPQCQGDAFAVRQDLSVSFARRPWRTPPWSRSKNRRPPRSGSHSSVVLNESNHNHHAANPECRILFLGEKRCSLPKPNASDAWQPTTYLAWASFCFYGKEMQTLVFHTDSDRGGI